MEIRNPRRKKTKLKARSLKPTAPIDMFENDLHARFELGSPAYRIAKNRSGLGYVETQAELARFQGTMLVRLATGKFHVTREPMTLIAMSLLGLFWAVIPCALLLAAFLLDPSVPSLLLLGTGFIEMAIGFFALGSVIKSMLLWRHWGKHHVNETD